LEPAGFVVWKMLFWVLLLLTLFPLCVPLLSARTCDLWVSEYNNGILNSEAFNATFNNKQ
jgi:hypothetical protein